MLEGLDQIAWHNLHHAYGPAGDVPGLIRQIAAYDPARGDAPWSNDPLFFLGNIINHQGNIYEATGYVVPFLNELLASSTVRCKSKILGLLQGMIKQPVAKIEAWAEKYFIEQERDPAEALQFYNLDIQRIREAAKSSLELYLNFLNNANVDVRIEAARLLSLFGEAAAQTAPALQKRIGLEPDARVKTRLISSLGKCVEDSPGQKAQAEIIDLFKQLAVAAHERRMVRFAAAETFTRLYGRHTPPHVSEVLESAVHHPSGITPDFRKGDRFRKGDHKAHERFIVCQACRALTRLDPEYGIPALTRSLASITDSTEVRLISTMLLELIFTGRSVGTRHQAPPQTAENYVYYETICQHGLNGKTGK